MITPPKHRYENFLMDSARWANFQPRADDVIIATPYKSGTTWMQRICSLIIFQRTAIEKPIAEISPWLDAKLDSIDDVLSIYETQTHRRFVKTHTPLTGIPYNSEATYLVCGRDPRDIFMSMLNHDANADTSKFAELIGLSEAELGAGMELPTDINERFQLWLSRPSFKWEQDGFPYWSVFYHFQSFWAQKSKGNIHFIHYRNLLKDLDREMRKISTLLNVPVDEGLWPELVSAASFDSMRKQANELAPNAHKGVWKVPENFFNKGSNDQWKGVLNEKSLTLYDSVKRQRIDGRLADWLEIGSN